MVVSCTQTRVSCTSFCCLQWWSRGGVWSFWGTWKWVYYVQSWHLSDVVPFIHFCGDIQNRVKRWKWERKRIGQGMKILVLQWQWESQRGGRRRSERKKKQMEKEGFISTGSRRSMQVDEKLSLKSNGSYLGQVFHSISKEAEKWVLLAGKKWCLVLEWKTRNRQI